MTTSPKPKKTWLRPTQITKKFPENKYDFLRHLRNLNDWVLGPPMDREDIDRMKKAVHAWAWRHKCRVITKAIRQETGLYKMYIRLSDTNRIREYK